MSAPDSSSAAVDSAQPDAKVGELAELIDGHPPIAARFLSVANSVVYFRGWRTSSTHSAIVRLGARLQLRSELAKDRRN